MSLQEVAIALGFAGGVDTQSDSKSVATTKVIALENGLFDKHGTIVKRTGYSALSKGVDDSTSAAYVTPHAIAGRGDELVLFADDRLYSYRDSTGTWNRGARAQSIVHTERPLANTGTDQSMADHATLSGITAVAWEDSRGGVWYSLAESDSGRQLVPPTQIGTTGAQSPRVCANGALLHVYFAVPAANRIYALIVNPASYTTTGAPIIVVGNLSSTQPSYDAQTLTPAVLTALGVGGGVVMAWVDATTNGYRVAYVTPDGLIGSAVTGFPAPVIYADAITSALTVINSGATLPFVAIGWVNFDALTIRFLDATNLAAGAGLNPVGTLPSFNFQRVTMVAGTPSVSRTGSNSTDVWIFAEEMASSLILNGRDNRVYMAWTDDSLGQDLTPTPLRGHGLVGKAFLDNGIPHVMVAHEVPFFPYVALLRFDIDPTDPNVDTVPTCIGRLVVGSSDGLPERTLLAQVHADPNDARIHRWVALSRDLVSASQGSEQFTETSVRLVTLDFDHPDAFQAVEFGADLVVAGALPLVYDGNAVTEFGFHCAPDGGVVATPQVSGSMTASSTYLYAFGYEAVDAQGLIHPGPLSVTTLVAMGAGQQSVKINVPTYRLTAYPHVRIVVYRTEANDTAGDTPDMYRVTSLDPSATGNNGYVTNSTSVDTIAFIDALSDLSLLARERAYTNSGVLNNDPVGLGHIVTGGKDRLFFSDPTAPNSIRYTQAKRDGYGPELSADLSLPLDSTGGDIGALAVLDDALIAWKRRAIFFVTGSGPLPNPDAAPQIGFAPPQQIPSDVGCTAPRALAVLSDRVMFQASDGAGIYHVDRSRQVSYIGSDVEAYNAQTVSAADLVPGTRRVVFLTASGQTLHYDYEHGQWSTFTNHQGLDSAIVGGEYHYLRSNLSDYRVFKAAATYLDAAAGIPLYFETAWIKLQGYHQGMQRIWYAALLGNYKSAHVLEVKVATDYRPGWDTPYVLAVNDDFDPANYGDGPYGDGPYGGRTDSVYQQRIPVMLKCQAVRFGIGETNNPTPQGASFELTELLLTGGAMRPMVSFGVKAAWGSSGGGGGGFGDG